MVVWSTTVETIQTAYKLQYAMKNVRLPKFTSQRTLEAEIPIDKTELDIYNKR